MTRLTAGDRLERLLSIVPWVVSNDGPTVNEIARRFDYPERSLLSDLTEILFMVGIYPFTPDQLVEVIVEEGRVWIDYAEYFERPLKLTEGQALALVTAGSSLLAVPGADPEGPLARGLAKLAETLGIVPGDNLEVNLGRADADSLRAVRESIDSQRQLRIEYYSYGRDEVTPRIVEPYRLASERGEWYLLAHCHRAGGERLFRLDRIARLEMLESTFTMPQEIPTVSIFEARVDDPRITLLLRPDAHWVAEAHPVERCEQFDDDTLRVTLAVTATAWLERLLLRLGPSATVESTTGDLEPDLAEQTALRVLARYSY